ncbi:hypothetical protein [Mangrovihabitans endophyticus]|uniref:Uncharacterized protein n=1 Tax=Mangrovihabitans endophyticus TaxID=1751298 RepID=A0A8J3FQ68_9ACTN|nr:hypothetical protein [Mangrovihabitans endophyticus]GGL07364.1 hypothetical protein GCM10012284_47060 [Mangrovihabitans endophyticus]
MVLSNRLAGWAARRPHALLVEVPGATAVRWVAEAELARAGAVAADSAADADLLVVAGAPGAELTAVVDEVWAQMPGPRARIWIAEPGAAAGAVAQALASLIGPGQAADAGRRRDAWAAGPATPDGGGSAEDGDEGDGMQMPGGLMMADRAPDRDGLQLDVLSVPLGPVLADWPAGLVVDVQVQGDVVQRAQWRLLGPAQPSGPASDGADADPGRGPGGRAASRLGALARLLGVAGWPAAAVQARRLRDAAWSGAPAAPVRTGLRRLDRRLRRSRALRWSTDGLGVLTPDEARSQGFPRWDAAGADTARTGHDATARWRGWLTEADALLAGEGAGRGAAEGDGAGHDAGREDDASVARARLDAAVRLMAGLDLAAARVVMASLDPHCGALAGAARRPEGTTSA